MESTTTKSTWPPNYQLRLSKKAKHVHLKITANLGLEIIVPIRQQKRFRVEELLIAKKSWIEKHLATLTIPALEHLAELSLQAIEQKWRIEYKQTLSKHIRHAICHGDDINTITLYGNVADVKKTHQCLKKWLMQIAKQYLIPWIYDLSIKHQLPFTKAAVRAQQTLWGSCTSAKNISLNYKLLFMPRVHAEHILLHELCHTKYINHSQLFWDLLQKLDANSQGHDRAIRHADRFVPVCLS